MGIRDKRAFRFSIAALLFLMLCLGGYLSGYRVGYQTGEQDADDAKVYVMTYPVADLLAAGPTATVTTASYDTLIDQIVSTVAPASWMENGAGDGEIQPFPSGKCIVISQNRKNHQGVASFLERVRTTQAKVSGASQAK
jgi:hypothetical protein